MMRRMELVYPRTLIYFLEAPDVPHRPIKVGRSDNPYARLASLQCASPVKLHMLGSVIADIGDEKRLHERWREHRMHHEWFDGAIRDEVVAILTADRIE